MGEDFKNSAVTILGSGGAAVTIAMKAAAKGARELHLVARNLTRPIRYAKDRKTIRYEVPSASILDSEKNGNQWGSRIIINTTPLGMKA